MYLGPSPAHSHGVGRILSLRTGHISPQYHVVYDEHFHAVQGRPTEDLLDRETWTQLLTLGGYSKFTDPYDDLGSMIPFHDYFDDFMGTPNSTTLEHDSDFDSDTGSRSSSSSSSSDPPAPFPVVPAPLSLTLRRFRFQSQREDEHELLREPRVVKLPAGWNLFQHLRMIHLWFTWIQYWRLLHPESRIGLNADVERNLSHHLLDSDPVPIGLNEVD